MILERIDCEVPSVEIRRNCSGGMREWIIWQARVKILCWCCCQGQPPAINLCSSESIQPLGRSTYKLRKFRDCGRRRRTQSYYDFAIFLATQ